MNTKLLSIGSVVLLKDSVKRVMIVGVCQKTVGETEKIWDYTGVVYPEGYLSSDKMFMFNHEQIERIYALGYQDEEQMAFNKKVEALLEDIRGNK